MYSGASKRGIIQSKVDLALMTAVLLLVFAFGANGLNTDPIWTDELYSITNMGGFDPPYSPQQIIDSITTYSPDHVPFYYLLGAAWAHLTGWNQVSMRFLSVLIGVAAVAWHYRLAFEMFNRRVGILSALLLATSAFVILYFHDIRMYTLLLLLAAMHSWAYWRIVYRPVVSRQGWLVMLLTCVLLLYTHVFAIMVFSKLVIYHVLFVKRTRRWLHVLLIWFCGSLLFLPYLGILISAVQAAADKYNVTSRTASVSELLGHFLYLLSNASEVMVLALIALLAWTFWQGFNPIAKRYAFSALATLLMIVILNELVAIIPLSRMRYLLIMWMPFTLLVAYGLASISYSRPIALIFLVFWAIAGFQFYHSNKLLTYIGGMIQARMHPPMHIYVEELRGKVRDHDYVLGFSFLDYVNAVHKFGDRIIDYYMGAQLGIDGAFIPSRWRDERLQADIVRKIDNNPFLLFTVEKNRVPPNFDDVSSFVYNNYQFCSAIGDTPTLVVERYVHPIAGLRT